MWLFTQYGFYSVVCARDLQGDPTRVDPTLSWCGREAAGISS